ncbi:MAG: hypothetical protein M9887_03450, partial [Chitinophagales bacterium]|nr:hypothetical protein [Chitinophagales bacterium]
YIGAVSRDLTGLLRNKNYELSFRLMEGARPLHKLQVLLLWGSAMSEGLLDPFANLTIDSLDISDSVSLRFTAVESSIPIRVLS